MLGEALVDVALVAGTHDRGLELLLGLGLDPRVDRGDEVVAGRRLGLGQHAGDAALVVDRQGLHAGRPAQVFVVLALEAGPADQVGALQHPLGPGAGRLAGRGPGGQLLVGDRPEVAELVGRVGAQRLCVLADRAELGRHPGEVLAPLHDLQRHRRAGLVGDRDRLVRRAVEAPGGGQRSLAAAQPGPLPHVGERLADHLRDLRDQLAPAVLLTQHRGPTDRDDQRGPVAGQRTATGVEDHAASGRGDDLAGAVLGGGLLVVLRREDLEVPQPPEQRDQQRQHEDLEDHQSQPAALAHRSTPANASGSGSTRPASASTPGTTNALSTTS